MSIDRDPKTVQDFSVSCRALLTILFALTLGIAIARLAPATPQAVDRESRVEAPQLADACITQPGVHVALPDSFYPDAVLVTRAARVTERRPCTTARPLDIPLLI